MKLSVMVAVVMTFASAAVCSAEPLRHGPYMSGFIGASVINDTGVTSEQYSTGDIFNDKVEFDPGVNAGITGGYNFGFFRMEGELSYKGGSINTITDKADNYRFRNVDGDVGVYAMMANGFFDLRNASAVTPYFGGGVGFATVYLGDTYGTDTRGGITSRDLLYYEDDTSVFAYQVGGGLEIALNHRLSLDLSYRYFATSKARFENSWDNRTEFSLRSNNAAVGLRVKF